MIDWFRPWFSSWDAGWAYREALIHDPAWWTGMSVLVLAMIVVALIDWKVGKR